MKIQLAKKWPEMVVQLPFMSQFYFESDYIIMEITINEYTEYSLFKFRRKRKIGTNLIQITYLLSDFDSHIKLKDK